MRTRLASAVVLLAGWLGVNLDANAAVFMRVEGLNGEVTAKGYEGWFKLEFFQVGHAVPPSKGQSPFEPLSVRKPVDSGSVWFAANAASGKRFHTVTVDHTIPGAAGETPIYRVVLRDVTLESYQVVGGETSHRPAESFALRYSRIEWIYFPTGRPPARSSWDVLTNTAF